MNSRESFMSSLLQFERAVYKGAFLVLELDDLTRSKRFRSVSILISRVARVRNKSLKRDLGTESETDP